LAIPPSGEEPPKPKIGENLTLERARQLASQCRVRIGNNIDPGAVVQDKAKDASVADRHLFEVAAQRFLERFARTNTRASTFRELVSLLGFRLEADGEKFKVVLRRPDKAKDPRPASTWPAIRWKGRALRTITKRDVHDLLDAIVDAEVPHAANSTLGAVRWMFTWCIGRGELEASPCQGIDKPVPPGKRERVLSDGELRLVWLGAEALGWPFGHLVKLLTLTAARRDEWAEARWSEIDRKRVLFLLPGARSKNEKAHNIPLSHQAIAVLDDLAKHRLKGDPDWLFSTGRGRKAARAETPLMPISGFSKAKLRLDAAILAIARREAQEAGEDPGSVKPLPGWRLHDLRRTATTGMARLRVPKEVAEKVLNHLSESFGDVGGIYDRHDYAEPMRDALARWADGVDRVVAGGELEPPPAEKLAPPEPGPREPEETNVIQLRA
jgi:integrase